MRCLRHFHHCSFPGLYGILATPQTIWCGRNDESFNMAYKSFKESVISNIVTPMLLIAPYDIDDDRAHAIYLTMLARSGFHLYRQRLLATIYQVAVLKIKLPHEVILQMIGQLLTLNLLQKMSSFKNVLLKICEFQLITDALQRSSDDKAKYLNILEQLDLPRKKYFTFLQQIFLLPANENCPSLIATILSKFYESILSGEMQVSGNYGGYILDKKTVDRILVIASLSRNFSIAQEIAVLIKTKPEPLVVDFTPSPTSERGRTFNTL